VLNIKYGITNFLIINFILLHMNDSTIKFSDFVSTAKCTISENLKWFLLFLSMLVAGISTSYSQGQFGGKVAVMDGLGNQTWYNMTSQTCDGTGTGNLSSGNPSAVSCYLGDKFYLGGNVLTYGFGSSGDKGELRYNYYAVGGSGTYSNFITLSYANNTVCGGGSNKKYELIPVSGTNVVQATGTGNYRLDVDLRGNNNGSIYSVYTSGNYIPFTVNALGNPTSCTATISGTTATLGWTKFVGGSVTYNAMIVRYPKMRLQLLQRMEHHML